MRNFTFGPTIKTIEVPIEWIGIGAKPNTCIDQLPMIDFFKQVAAGVDPEQTEYAKHYKEISNCFHVNSAWRDDVRRWARESLEKGSRALDNPLPAKLNANGIFELLDGHHRGSQGIADEAESFTLDIKHVSPTWRRIHDALYAVMDKQFLYQPIEHPWFADWDHERDEKRLELIVHEMLRIKETGLLASNVHLDIGCCSGRLCRESSRAGFGVIGVDSNENIVHVADYLNMVFGLDPSYFHSTLNSFLELGDDRYAVITCLSVIHHLLRAGSIDEYLRSLDMIVNRSVVFFIDQTSNVDYQAENDTVPIESDAFEAWLKNRYSLKSLKKLGTFGHRPLFVGSLRGEI